MFRKKETAMNGSGNYRFGKLTKNGYKSEFLGYKCKAPKGGIFSSEEDLLRMSNINPALRVSNPDAFREVYYSGNGILDMFLTLESGATMFVHWQYYPANLHGGMNVAQLVAERQMDINRENGGTSEGMPQSREIMGRDFVGITTSFTTTDGNTRYLQEYYHECTNGMITIAVNTTQYTFSEGQMLLELLKKC